MESSDHVDVGSWSREHGMEWGSNRDEESERETFEDEKVSDSEESERVRTRTGYRGTIVR